MEGDKCLFTCVAEGIVEGSWDLFPDMGLAGGGRRRQGEGGREEVSWEQGLRVTRVWQGGGRRREGEGKEEEVSWEQGLGE